jgi:hypothetical protein
VRGTLDIDIHTSHATGASRRSIIDRLRKCVTIRVEFRVNGQRGEFAVSSRLGRHPVREMRERSLV